MLRFRANTSHFRRESLCAYVVPDTFCNTCVIFFETATCWSAPVVTMFTTCLVFPSSGITEEEFVWAFGFPGARFISVEVSTGGFTCHVAIAPIFALDNIRLPIISAILFAMILVVVTPGVVA